ncbi:MAG: DUF5989 family protein [Deltaproteobacteria bacterium]|jgi:hypothetical protein
MSNRTEFQEEAGRKSPSLLHEFILFLADNKKWWLLPIVAVLAAVGLLAAFAGTGAAPFIYTMF